MGLLGGVGNLTDRVAMGLHVHTVDVNLVGTTPINDALVAGYSAVKNEGLFGLDFLLWPGGIISRHGSYIRD